MADPYHHPYALERDRLSPVGLAVVAGLHVVAGAMLLSYQPVRQVLGDTVPIFVRMIVPEASKPPVMRAEQPPKPKPILKRPRPPAAATPRKPRALPPQPVATAEPIPPRIEAPAPPPEPAQEAKAPPITVAESPPTLSASPGPSTRSAPPDLPPSPAPPAPVTPPSFMAAYLSNPALSYPTVSRRLGEEGKVLLRVLVDPNGLPQRIELEATSGYPRLDRAAIETVKRWKFVPARQGATTHAAFVLVPIVFKLER